MQLVSKNGNHGSADQGAIPDALRDEIRGRLISNIPAKLSLNTKRLLGTIHENFLHSDFNVKIAKIICDVHDNNISCQFKRELGVGIKEYIENARMHAASVILEQSTLSIMETAYVVGYWHIQTFYRAFERRFGCPPSTYRKRINEQRVICASCG